MSKLVEYHQLEKHLTEQLRALEALKGDGALKTEIEFETKFRCLLDQYGFSLKHIINLIHRALNAVQLRLPRPALVSLAS